MAYVHNIMAFGFGGRGGVQMAFAAHIGETDIIILIGSIVCKQIKNNTVRLTNMGQALYICI